MPQLVNGPLRVKTRPIIPVKVASTTPVLTGSRKGMYHGLFYGPTCLQHHRTNGTCEKYHTCTSCYAEYRTDKEHVCGQDDCYSCRQIVNIATHKCYIQRPYEAKCPY